MLRNFNFHLHLLKFSSSRNMILVFFLLLCCVSLQAQMYIGKGVTIKLEGSSSIFSDSIILDSGSKSIAKYQVKKVGQLYILSGNNTSLASREKSPELKSQNSKFSKKKKNEFLGEEKSKQLAKAPIPNPKPQIIYTSQNRDDFKLKPETEVYALAGNPIVISKKSISAVNFKKKIAAIIINCAQEKSKSFFLKNAPLSVYLTIFRSRPPPFSDFI